MAKRGPKPKYEEIPSLKVKNIVVEKNKQINITDKKVHAILQTKVRTMANSSGGYITVSQDYGGHKAYVIIMEAKIK
ncbi:MAG: hypothetical protein KKB31_05020 [Nanoarchaeota archaeon]|nr:hypothetical protein [Nanoarchaeota archaeon]